jgi:hypothetical protein
MPVLREPGARSLSTMRDAKLSSTDFCRRHAGRAVLAAVAVSTLMLAAAPTALAGGRSVVFGRFGGRLGGAHVGFRGRRFGLGVHVGRYGFRDHDRHRCGRFASLGRRYGGFRHHGSLDAFGGCYRRPGYALGWGCGYGYGYAHRGPAYDPPHVRGFTIPGANSHDASPTVLEPFSNADQVIKPLVQAHPEVARVYAVPPVQPSAGVAMPSTGARSVSEIRRYDPHAASDSPYTYPSLLAPSQHDGWSMLAEGRTGEALAAFASRSIDEPSDGAPRAGYAIAAALNGNLDKGAWAMRRAFRIDPAPLRYVVGDARLTRPIRLLIDRYEDRLVHPSRRADATFMIAALSYLVHDDVEARVAIEKAVAGGDSSTSAANLLRLARAVGPAKRDGSAPTSPAAGGAPAAAVASD